MSIKPEPVLREFFRMFVDEFTTMLDPTCGSGTALRAAEGLGAKRVLGIEIDKEFVDRANL
jgi:DNA modification methylase